MAVLTGDNGANTLEGGAETDILEGLGGADTLDGNGNVDILRGGSGNDTYIIDDPTEAEDTIQEFEEAPNPLDSATPGDFGGIDTVESARTYMLGDFLENLTLTENAITGSGNGLDNIIIGNAQDNNLEGSGGDDELEGGAGDDTLDGGEGSDVFRGGTGNDTYKVDGEDSANAITELEDEGTDEVISTADYTLSANLEDLTLQGDAISGTGNADSNTIIGNARDNFLDGGGGIDSLLGGLGDDTYTVNSINDNISELAGEGTDTVKSSGNFILDANVENLTLTGTAAIDGTGNSGNNTITGNSAANTLDGEGGADTLIGASGNDTYVVDDADDIVNEGSFGNIDGVISSINYTLGANLENLTLSGSATIGTGNSEDNTIIGTDVANTLSGGQGGDDLLIGADGDDLYIVNSTSDDISEAASEGTDTVQSSATFVLDTNVENLTLTDSGNFNGTGNGVDNVIIGNEGNNVLEGRGGNDDLSGGEGNDVLDGEGGTDTLSGGLGNDTYIIDATPDTVTEAVDAGTDTVESSVTYTLDDNVERLTLTGTSAINGTGNSLANEITGNSAANELRGLGGTDTLIGGLGNDTYYVDNTPDVITEGSGGGIDSVFSSVEYTLGATSNLENLILLEAAGDATATGNNFNNTINGNSFGNTLNGLGGNDTINGGGGTDLLDGGTGADRLQGGAGNDTYIVDSVSDTTIEGLTEGDADTVRSSVSYTLSANVENLELQGNSAINGTGNSLGNEITGNSAANTLDGSGGADTLTGLGGNDTYIVDNLGDLTIEAAGAGTDTVRSSVTRTLGTNLENLTLTGGGDINGTGNSANNTINGNSGDNELDGGTGTDRLQGGAGDDTYVVDRTTDQTIESTGAGIDTVESGLSWTLAVNVENLTFTGSGDINGTGNGAANTITGNSGDNTLTGKGGNDTLTGGGGSDTLVGGAGNDVLNGNAGSDFYRFSSPGEGIDDITFIVVEDTIQVSRAGFGGGLSLGTLAASQFVIGSAAADSSDRFIYNSSTGALSFDANGNVNGNSEQVQFATLSSGLNMTNNDISIIA